MTIGIYSITHVDSGKRYVGKSKNIERRFSVHKSTLVNPNSKGVNRHLHAAVLKYGIDSFRFEILESFDTLEPGLIGERELFYIDQFNTCNRCHGYNLRRDTSTGMVVLPETTELKRAINRGEKNPNYGNKWSKEQKAKMSALKKEQHRDSDSYGDQYKQKQSENSKKFWSTNPNAKKNMARKVSARKRKYDFLQLSKNDDLIKQWCSIEEIIEANPNYKWQNIYAACNGSKPTYQGYKWQKVLKNEN